MSAARALLRDDGAERLGPRLAADTRGRAARRAGVSRRGARRSTSWTASSRPAPSRSSRGRRRRARASTGSSARRAESRARRGARPRARANASRSTSSSSSVSRKAALPRRARPSPFLADDARRELGGRLERPDAVARDRYLFYTRARVRTQRLVLVREAASDEGVPRDPSPFWEDVRVALRRGRRAARDPPTAALGAHVAARGGAERARAASRRSPASTVDDPDGAFALAAANDWSARLDRARGAFDPHDGPPEPGRARAVRRQARCSPRPSWSASPTARRRGSSSASIDPKKIDAEPDPMLRGQVAAHDAEPLLRDAPA